MNIIGILNFLVSFAVLGGIYAIFCMGLNVHWGYTGLLNFGIAGFFAIGAYTSALVTSIKIPPIEGTGYVVHQLFGFGMPFLIGVISAAVVSGCIALLIGLLTLRLKEGYLAICTIGIAESIRIVFNNEQWLANGSQGLRSLVRPFQDIAPGAAFDYVYLVIVLIFVALIFLALERGIRSPWGRVLRAIREDEVMANADGKNVVGFKLQSLCLGAVIMGIGGALYTHYFGAVQPDVFDPLFATFIVWIMLIVGGTGNNKGAIIGAYIIWALWSWSKYLVVKIVPSFMATRAPYLRYVIIGILLVVMIIKRPKGILGEEKHVSKF